MDVQIQAPQAGPSEMAAGRTTAPPDGGGREGEKVVPRLKGSFPGERVGSPVEVSESSPVDWLVPRWEFPGA